MDNNVVATDVLAEAMDLVETLTATAVDYQLHFRASDQIGSHKGAMAELSDAWNPEPSAVMIRQLEMASYDEVATALDELSTAVFRVVSALDTLWDYDEAVENINFDVGALRAKVLQALADANDSPSGPAIDPAVLATRKERVTLLQDAAILADKMHSLGLEHESYREGTLPLPQDENETSSDRMQLVAKSFGDLAVAPVHRRLEDAGFHEAAAALVDLHQFVLNLTRLGESEPLEGQDKQIVDDLGSALGHAIDELRSVRDADD